MAGSSNATITSAASGSQIVTQQVVNVVASNQDSMKTNAPLVTTQPGVVVIFICTKIVLNTLPKIEILMYNYYLIEIM